MCIARVGRVAAVSEGRARIDFFDGRSLGDVDITMVTAKEGAYVEVFGNLALSELTPSEAKARKKAWDEVRRGASPG